MHIMFRALVSCVICIWANSACRSSIRSPRPPGPGEIVPRSPTPDLPARPGSPRIHWTTSQHSLSIRVITEETSIGRRDSTELLSSIVLRPDSAKQVLQAYLSSDISAPVPVAVDSLLVLQLDAEGVMRTATTDSSCISRSPMLSPLVIRPLFPRYARTWPAEDILSYHICISGVPAQVNARIRWDSPTLEPDSTTRTHMIHLNGTVSADSTHTLPLRLAGSLTGNGHVTTDFERIKVIGTRFIIQLNLTGVSASRRQELTQTLTITKLPPH